MNDKMLQKEINIKNRVYYYYYDDLVKADDLQTKNIEIDWKRYKDLVICFC